MRISSLAIILWLLLICLNAPSFIWVIGLFSTVVFVSYVFWREWWWGKLRDKYDREGPGYDDFDKLDAWYSDYAKKHPIASFFYNIGVPKYRRI